jgi:ubiquinol oxidase
VHSLLEEAENERMHLLTFLTLKKPSIGLRAVVIAGQVSGAAVAQSVRLYPP